MSALKSTFGTGQTATKDTKTFEICFDHEPTPEETYSIQNVCAAWQNMRVIKLYPATTKTEKMYGGKFWSLTFEVHKDDWLFWCGFCAGKNWGVANNGRGDTKKKRLQEIGQYVVQI